MKNYRRTQGNKIKSRVGDQKRIVAVANFVEAIDADEIPDSVDMGVVAQICRDILNGNNCEESFGFRSKQSVGHPGHEGFTPSDVVAAYVERERRHFGGGRGALSKAFAKAQSAFVESLNERVIQRDWANSRGTVEPLIDHDLDKIIEPYLQGQKNK